jgi:hypothetical protein
VSDCNDQTRRVGTTRLQADGTGGALTALCEIVVKKNRITTVIVSVAELPVRQHGGPRHDAHLHRLSGGGRLSRRGLYHHSQFGRVSAGWYQDACAGGSGRSSICFRHSSRLTDGPVISVPLTLMPYHPSLMPSLSDSFFSTWRGVRFFMTIPFLM